MLAETVSARCIVHLGSFVQEVENNNRYLQNCGVGVEVGTEVRE